MPSVTAAQALADYLGLGADRSLDKLHAIYVETQPRPPHPQTLRLWSGKHKWVAKAAAHDRKVSKRLAARAQTEQVRREWSVVQLLQQTIDIALEATSLRAAAAAAVERGDFAGLVRSAIEAAKLREVMTGGVSDRSESRQDVTVTDERQQRARQRIDDIFAAAADAGRGAESLH